MARPSYLLEGWVARDWNGQMHLFTPNKPMRHPDGYPWWIGYRSYEIPETMYERLRWSDEPLKVRIELWKAE